MLTEVAKIGYQSVEPGRGALAQLSPICRELKLTTPSVHIETPLVTGNWDAWKGMKETMPAGYDLARAIDDSKAHGARFLVVSYLMQAERSLGGLDCYRKFAGQMNAAGEQCRKAGLQLCYHHHSFEFDPAGGQRPFDILVERFDRKAVMFQCDIFWMKIGGLSGFQQALPDPAQAFQMVMQSEMTIYWVVMVSINSLFSAVAQPHLMPSVASGRNELDSQVGYVGGLFLKRLMTVAWALTGVMAIAMFGPGTIEPDHAFGLMAREVLPVGVGENRR